MKIHGLHPFVALSLACLWLLSGLVPVPHAIAGDVPPVPAPIVQPPAAAAPSAPAPAQAAPESDDEEDSAEAGSPEEGMRAHRHGRLPRRFHSESMFSIGHDVSLAAGEQADSVVSIDGSASSAGDADSVVSIFGDTRVTGAVHDSAVAVFGSTYVDSAIDGDVVAVLGNVELGPHAEVGGDVVAVGGEIHRAPSAIVHGTVQSIARYAPGFTWLRPWIQHCLFYGRPLAFAAGIDWAWGIAIAMLALYLCFVLLFREGVMHCVRTMETHPGMTVLAALLTVLLCPLLFVLLGITVIGLAAVPLIGAGLMCATLFGKAAVLTWLGQRCLGSRNDLRGQPVVAALIGGLIMLVLYVIPVLGFIAFQVLGLLGLGVVVYTLVLEIRSRRGAANGGGFSAAPPAGVTAAAAPAATGADRAAGPEPAAAAVGAAAVDAAASAAAVSAAEPIPGAGAAPDASELAAPRAGFWIRMAALVVDVLVIGIPATLLHDDHLHLILLAVYGAVMWKLKGATVGCMVFDLRVLRLDGRPIEWETAIVRALSCFLSLAVGGLGFFWIAFDQAKQAWHDKIAGTVVVRVRRSPGAENHHHPTR